MKVTLHLGFGLELVMDRLGREGQSWHQETDFFEWVDVIFIFLQVETPLGRVCICCSYKTCDGSLQLLLFSLWSNPCEEWNLKTQTNKLASEIPPYPRLWCSHSKLLYLDMGKWWSVACSARKVKAVTHLVVWKGSCQRWPLLAYCWRNYCCREVFCFALVVCYYAEENSYGETLEAFSKLFLLLVGDRLFWHLLFVNYVVM